jgi:hypothetical protein
MYIYKLETTILDRFQLRRRGAILKESSRTKSTSEHLKNLVAISMDRHLFVFSSESLNFIYFVQLYSWAGRIKVLD